MFVDNNQTQGTLEPCGDATHEHCGVRFVLDRLGEKWSVMTVAELAAGSRRYRELERALDGITQRMLTLTLRRLERDGFVARTVEPTNPPSVTYELTPLGKGFAGAVVNLIDWSRSHKEMIASSHEQFDRAKMK